MIERDLPELHRATKTLEVFAGEISPGFREQLALSAEERLRLLPVSMMQQNLFARTIGPITLASGSVLFEMPADEYKQRLLEGGTSSLEDLLDFVEGDLRQLCRLSEDMVEGLSELWLLNGDEFKEVRTEKFRLQEASLLDEFQSALNEASLNQNQVDAIVRSRQKIEMCGEGSGSLALITDTLGPSFRAFYLGQGGEDRRRFESHDEACRLYLKLSTLGVRGISDGDNPRIVQDLLDYIES